MRARARQRLLTGEKCADKHVVHEDPNALVFVVSGCNLMAKVEVQCDREECTAMALSGTEMEQPRRLQTTDGRTWRAGAPVPGPAVPAVPLESVTVKTGKRLTALGPRSLTPTLPPELDRSGLTVWGLYKICVNAGGEVEQVEVVQSALPGGLDGSWVHKIEQWRYQPYEVNGRPVPFCYPQRLQFQSAS